MQTNIRNQYSILIFILSTLLATSQLFVSYFYTESDANSDNTNSQYYYFNKVAAPNQPPSYVFGIVWTILIICTIFINYHVIIIVLTNIWSNIPFEEPFYLLGSDNSTEAFGVLSSQNSSSNSFSKNLFLFIFICVCVGQSFLESYWVKSSMEMIYQIKYNKKDLSNNDSSGNINENDESIMPPLDDPVKLLNILLALAVVLIIKLALIFTCVYFFATNEYISSTYLINADVYIISQYTQLFGGSKTAYHTLNVILFIISLFEPLWITFASSFGGYHVGRKDMCKKSQS